MSINMADVEPTASGDPGWNQGKTDELFLTLEIQSNAHGRHHYLLEGSSFIINGLYGEPSCGHFFIYCFVHAFCIYSGSLRILALFPLYPMLFL